MSTEIAAMIGLTRSDTPAVAGWMKRNKEVAQAIIKQTPRGTIGDPR
jgi:hypothetical protein